MEPYLLGGAFIVSSIIPTIYFKKLYAKTISAEDSTPKILRTISEARKTGMSPESSIIHACKRKEYGLSKDSKEGGSADWKDTFRREGRCPRCPSVRYWRRWGGRGPQYSQRQSSPRYLKPCRNLRNSMNCGQTRRTGARGLGG